MKRGIPVLRVLSLAISLLACTFLPLAGSPAVAAETVPTPKLVDAARIVERALLQEYQIMLYESKSAGLVL